MLLPGPLVRLRAPGLRPLLCYLYRIRFHRIRDVKQYKSNSVPPASQYGISLSLSLSLSLTLTLCVYIYIYSILCYDVMHYDMI